MRRIYDGLNAALLALIAYSILSPYSKLPDRVPVHFKVSGNPDRWGSKSELLLLIGLSFGMTMIFYAIILVMPRLSRNPRYLNIPYKSEFLKLKPEKQKIYWEFLQEFLAGMTVAINLVFYLIIHGTLRIAQEKAKALAFKDVSLGILVLALVMAYYFPRLFSLPKKLIRDEEP